MKTIFLFMLAAVQLGCGAGDTIDNLTTITLGAEVLSPIRVERAVELGSARLPACVDVTLSDDSSQTTARLQKTAAGCALTVEQRDLVLLDAEQAKRARDQAGPFDIDGVRAGSVVVQTLQLQNADGSPIDLGQYIASVSLELNGEALLDHVNPSSLGDDMHRKLSLPTSVVNDIKAAVKTNQVATAEAAVSLVFTSAVMNALPSSLKVSVILQPELEVDITKAL